MTWGKSMACCTESITQIRAKDSGKRTVCHINELGSERIVSLLS